MFMKTKQIKQEYLLAGNKGQNDRTVPNLKVKYEAKCEANIVV